MWLIVIKFSMNNTISCSMLTLPLPYIQTHTLTPLNVGRKWAKNDYFKLKCSQTSEHNEENFLVIHLLLLLAHRC